MLVTLIGDMNIQHYHNWIFLDDQKKLYLLFIKKSS